MANKLSAPTPLSPDDKVQFVEAHRPRLKSGDYTITVEQKITVKKKAPTTPDKTAPDITTPDITATATENIAVAGERYTVKESEVHAVFPPPNSHGPYHRVLPHISFTRSTLPWERPPRAGKDEYISPSWMALLLFAGDEIPNISTVRVADLKKKEQSDKTLGPLTEVKWRPLPDEVTEHPDDAVQVIDVPWSILKQQVPTYEDLRVISHVRRVEYAHPDADPDDEPPELAVIIGSRLPPAGQSCAVHLVSLEERYDLENPWEDGHETFALSADAVKLADLKNLFAVKEVKELIASSDSKGQKADRREVVIRLQSGQTAQFRRATPRGSDPITKNQIKSLLPQHTVEQLDLQDPTWVRHIKGLGMVSGVVKRVDHVENGRLVQRLSTTVHVPAEIAALSNGQVFDWLKVAHANNSSELVLEIGKLPVWIAATNGAEHPVNKDVTPLSGDITSYTNPIAEAGGWFHARLDGVEFVGYVSVFATRKAGTNQKAHIRLQLCTSLGDDLLLKLFNSTKGKELRLEEGQEPLVLEPFDTHGLKVETPTPTSVQDFAKACLPAMWQARVNKSGRVNLAGELKLDDGHMHLTLVLNTERKKKSKNTSPVDTNATLNLTVRPSQHLYFNPLGATDNTKLRLISLKSWNFQCDPEGKDFVSLLQHLNFGEGRDAELRKPKGNLNDASKAHAYLQGSYAPISHRLRGGGRTVSWYRGPLIAKIPADEHTEMPLPAASADELVIFDQEIGMFNVSYAAAWELGRMLCMADKPFSLKLHQWKRERRDDLTWLRQQVDHAYLPVLQRIPEQVRLPEEVTDWLTRLTRLEGVPFNYLLPEEDLLPAESIRFFVLDPLWLECLRDGAMSVGRVLRTDHGYDHDHWSTLPKPPRISGFLLRSAAVSGFPKMSVRGYVLTASGDLKWQEQGHLDDDSNVRPLHTLRQVNLGPDLLLCLYYDKDPKRDEGHALNLLELHLPPQVLHCGLEEGFGEGSLVKKLRDPRTGNQLTEVVKGKLPDNIALKWVTEVRLTGNALVSALQAAEDQADVLGKLAKDTYADPWVINYRDKKSVTAEIETTLGTEYTTFSSAVSELGKTDVEHVEWRIGPAGIRALNNPPLDDKILRRLVERMLPHEPSQPGDAFWAEKLKKQIIGALTDEKASALAAPWMLVGPKEDAIRDDLKTAILVETDDLKTTQQIVDRIFNAGDKSVYYDWSFAPDKLRKLHFDNRAKLLLLGKMLKSILPRSRKTPEILDRAMPTDAPRALNLLSEAGIQDTVLSLIWEQAEKSVNETIDLHAGQTDALMWRTGGVLNMARLFEAIADRLQPIMGSRPATAADFGLQMLDAAPMIRVFREPPIQY